jgi:hypothetical protein
MHHLHAHEKTCDPAATKIVDKLKLNIIDDDILQQVERQRIMLPRWLTNKIAEYDMINEYWVVRTLNDRFNPINNAKNEMEFFAFSNTVFVNSSSLVVLGGLDDKVASLPNFSNRALLLTAVPETQYDNHYDLKLLENMYSKRGCASAVFH